MQQQRIKTARRDNGPQGGKIVLRRTQQPGLFYRAYAGGSPAEIGAAPQPHLDENQSRTILHDQIDLAETAPVVPLQQPKAPLLQKRGCLLLRLLPGLHSPLAGAADAGALAAAAARFAALRAANPAGVSPRPCLNSAISPSRSNW